MSTWPTSTSHIKFKKFVQNNNCEGQRSKHFVFDTHYQVSCVGLSKAGSLKSLSRQYYT
ncbi:hypothetical protein A671_04326 [Salmonella enterica subsp. enterica serovar Dublin str. DG22]|uniref:Uncharacterized protein n=3 Tax=Salmonella enterica I TaxID=59201 RepID=M7RCV7_SALDU|nr:hypothetical protein SPAB_00640 [Salmonella enterica subsp. enterica serovar Paratyphi B str. SPB7]EMR49593.1 hypothetical protein A670_05215 [Salmonella enterica subsp. enterica serovar Dublin str. UC16]EPI65264.1 hypothetical protein A671_04326 [Salmonella enterica subsp. enterica serovar Dublin str. DG22]EPJ01890.1 hypothetical protein A677_01426 [Salmonella enterica subsp. enterica serovar Enteritidis str. 2010K-0267]EPJ05196.1 hypothetical protein A679_00801 [Salmonella enterica subsp. 